MSRTEAARKFRGELGVAFGLFTEEVELVLLVAVRQLLKYNETRTVGSGAHNRPVRVLISFFSKDNLSVMRPELEASAKSNRSRHTDGLRIPRA
jgi:hypothetical protein